MALVNELKICKSLESTRLIELNSLIDKIKKDIKNPILDKFLLTNINEK